MKKRLLFLTLAIAMACVGCSKEKDYPEPPEQVLPDNDPFDGFNVTDTVGVRGVNVTRFSDELAIISFTKNERLWMGLYDNNTKNEIQTWTGGLPPGLDQPDCWFNLEWHRPTKRGYVLHGRFFDEYSIENTTSVIFLNTDKKELLVAGYYSEFQKVELLGDMVYIVNYYSYNTDLGTLVSLEGAEVFSSVSSMEINDRTFYVGFDKDDKLWFGVLSDPEKGLEEEWTTNEK